MIPDRNSTVTIERNDLPGEMMDWILVVLGILFLGTTSAFILGFIPYPIGWIVLGLLFFLRLTQIRNTRK